MEFRVRVRLMYRLLLLLLLSFYLVLIVVYGQMVIMMVMSMVKCGFVWGTRVCSEVMTTHVGHVEDCRGSRIEMNELRNLVDFWG